LVSQFFKSIATEENKTKNTYQAIVNQEKKSYDYFTVNRPFKKRIAISDFR